MAAVAKDDTFCAHLPIARRIGQCYVYCVGAIKPRDTLRVSLMLLLSANDAAIVRAVVNGTLVVREAFNARLRVTYWAIEDEFGLIEVARTEAEARYRVALLEDVVNALATFTNGTPARDTAPAGARVIQHD